jgi:hypothetical protein
MWGCDATPKHIDIARGMFDLTHHVTYHRRGPRVGGCDATPKHIHRVRGMCDITHHVATTQVRTAILGV